MNFKEESLKKIEQKRKEWETGPLKKNLERFGVTENPDKFYTPLDIRDFDFLEKVGFPGEYPFTAGIYPFSPPARRPQIGRPEAGAGRGATVERVGGYSGYGTPEDTRDYYISERTRAGGRRGGPNIAFDLPTQCGLDSDDPRARGEVGRTGVAVDTLEDFEVIYEAFQGENDLDKISSAWTINAPSNIILAMYVALAEKRNIPLNKLRCDPQNDILKEFIARGTYIFPPRPSMRMFRDSAVYSLEHMPLANIMSGGGYHIREAGATLEQTSAFAHANFIAYVQTLIDSGLEPDSFLPRINMYAVSSGGMELLKEIAGARAARRIYAKIMRDRFGAKDPRGWINVGARASNGYWTATTQRPLNNLTRSVLGGFASALASGGRGRGGGVAPAFDEPLGLGWSIEGRQLQEDAGRIIQYEAKLGDVIDPFAGSYYMESLTDQVEEEVWKEIKKIDNMGGAVAAIENGYMQTAVAKSAYEWQRKVETGEEIVVGVNAFTDEHQLEVLPKLTVGNPYDPKKREEAEEKQVKKLARIKRERDNHQVQTCLARIQEATRDEKTNLIPSFVEAVRAYTSLGEICGVLREVFGEYSGYTKI